MARAAEWVAQPSIWWYLDYDTNRRLAPAGEAGQPADAAGYMTLDLLLRRLTETGSLDVHPQIEFQRFTKDAALNANNGSLQLTGSHRGELWKFTGNAGYAENSTLVSEIASTGIIDTNTRQNALTADVSATRELSARQDVSGSLSYADITYPGGLPYGLVGYQYPNASLSYAYTYSPATTGSLIASGGELLAEHDLPRQKTAALRVQVEHSFSSLLTLTAAAGGSKVDESGINTTGAVWNFTLVRRTDREGNWAFTFLQDFEPNGTGQLVRHQEADLSLLRAVSSHLFVTLMATGIRNQEVITSGTLGYHNYFAGNAGFEWRPHKEWQVSFTGGYSQSSQPGQYAHGWRGAMTLRWTPPAWRVSR